MMSDHSAAGAGVPSVLVPDTRNVMAAFHQSHGVVENRDAVLLTRTATTEIWHTEKTAPGDCPSWPPGPDDVELVFRGVEVDLLRTVLETGLDLPAQSPFFATEWRKTAWRYPSSRNIAALLMFDGRLVQRSFVTDAAEDTAEDYPYRYVDGGITVHTRLPLTRCGSLTAERLYGYWIPGDARAALCGVILGGAYCDVVEALYEAGLETVDE